VDDRFHKYLKPCSWGVDKFSVNGKGNLSRCGADPRYQLGNILETPLEKIWANSQELISFRNRDYLSEKCRKCVYLEKCGGGCPLCCSNDILLGADYLMAGAGGNI